MPISEELIRTPLFSLKPQDGRFGVECLTSYVSRLAKHHCISVNTLINHVLAPQLRKNYVERIVRNGGTGFLSYASSINGIGRGAFELTTILQNLTGVNHLDDLTFLRFAGTLSVQHLVRPKKAWCPLCYQEMLESGNEIYEPLVWTLQTVQVCPIHLTPLNNECKECHGSSYWWERSGYPGYCKCGAWLGSSQNNLVNPEILEDSLVSARVGSELTEINRYGFVRTDISMCKIIDYIASELHATRAVLANQLHIPKSTLHGWYHGTSRISLRFLAHTCYVLNVSLADLFSCACVPKPGLRKIPRSRKQRNANKLATDVFEQKLRDYLSNTDPKSLTKIAEELGVNRRLIGLTYPSIAQQIIIRYRTSREEARNKRFVRLSQEIHETVRCLVSNGVAPTRRNVESALEKPGMLREPALKEVWKYETDNYNTKTHI